MSTLQKWFHAAVTAPLDHDHQVEEIDARLTPGPRLGAIGRLGVYHRSYWGRLVECLADDYPTVQHALGHDAFEALAHDYIARFPSAGPNLNAFGRHMSAFCRTRPLVAACDPIPNGFLADLASLEWAIVEVVHAPQPAALAPDVLQRIPPDRWADVRFEGSPSVRLLEHGYPANAYFQAVKDDKDPQVPPPAPAFTAVYRDAYTVWRWDLPAAATVLLRGLLSGATLGEAIEKLADDPAMLAEAGANLAGWFKEWVGRGFFAKVEETRAGTVVS